ncbi:SDR family NAD(P)-dependent oxidoreductase [Paenibacillus sp. FSL R7-0331]|uniref:SDR family NAD(P)-dependent oxidoreductase n=1 Tax=Paenibacillus sp. FSL R7-0331 TaxID=1536773 RepID=UPI000AC9F532|nr:SDR family NAD(P)-dependent oxidoreductase [Paenibacillus sp. FSL R7-0331]
MNNVKRFILDQLGKQILSQQEAVQLLSELQNKETESTQEIAIIGTACRLPMANNPEEFWDNLLNGRTCLSPKPADKLIYEKVFKNKHYAEFVGMNQITDDHENLEDFLGLFVEDMDKFDANFFGIPPREAKCIDPEQRVFMEVAWSAIEDAGYGAENIKNTKTGVFVGKDSTTTTEYKYITEWDQMTLSGIWSGILASRINYIFNLKGPAMVLDTACSSGLVALHEACNSIRNQECEMALAGGISIGSKGAKSVSETEKAEEEANGVMQAVSSNDNRVRSFDKKSSGTVFGEGVVVFVLKSLAKAVKDRDHIYGIIKGSAINNDGASNGLTAPNPLAQEEVIIDAWKRAKVAPESISYVEAHGTATQLGDPIEILSLSNAFSKYTDRKQFCGIGSVKTSIGHTVGASGPANLLKVLLSMNQHTLPPSLHFEEPNPHINFMDSPIFVVDKVTHWEDNEQPLRAGVSSYGFSGTNCHMVVEEYQEGQDTKTDISRNNILTLSAKTETAMLNIIKNYDKYLENKTQLNIDNLCFTANTGRGDYGYRVAMVINSLEQLKENIALLSQNGLNSIEDKQIFYNKNHVVSDKRQHKQEGEITESELRHIKSQAQKIADTLKDREEDEGYCSMLLDLCALYVKGANVDWTQVYGQGLYSRIPLPTYPFDRTHYWGDVKITKIASEDAAANNQALHPLVERCLVDSMRQNIYLMNFNLKKHWVLQDHKIMGGNILPGTAYIEVIKESFRQCYDNENVVIKNIVFLSPLVVSAEDEDIETHIVITKEEGDASFSVVSRHANANGDTWIEHARGNAYFHNDTVEKTAEFNSIVTDPEVTVLPLKTTLEENAMNAFGERWNCVQHFYQTKDEEGLTIYTEVKIPDKLSKDLEEYACHPGLMDTAVNMATMLLYQGEEHFLPFSYKGLKFYKKLPGHFYSKIRRIPKGNDSEIMSFNVVLADMEGNIIAEIEETSLKKINNIHEYVNNSFYGVRWAPQAADKSESLIPDGGILIFTDQSGLSSNLAGRLQTLDNQLYFVSFGEAFAKLDSSHYTVGSSEEDYLKLLESIGPENISTVYHLSTINFNQTDFALEQYPVVLNQGLYSLAYLTRSFLNMKNNNVNFVLLTENAHAIDNEEAYIKPANASFLALAKATQAECPLYTYKCIDIDDLTSIDTVMNEALRIDKQAFRVAYRNNVRYTEMLVTIDVQPDDIKEVKIKNEGIYLITGGTGGLGLETALLLGDSGPCNICLLGRRKLQERSEWQAVLDKEEDKKACSLIRGIQRLESKGCNVILRYTDVCDADQMNTIVEELKTVYGRINGVVHCAGVAGDGFLFRKDMDNFNSVLTPKVFGTVIIDELTRDQELDFFILFSSMQSLFGGLGQGDYTAANAFLDAYASYLSKKGLAAQTINWPGWSETGMAVDYQVADSLTMFKSLDTHVAISALDNVMNSKLSNVVPGQINLDMLGQIGEDNLPFGLSEDLQKKVARYKRKNKDTGSKEVKKLLNPEDLLILGKGKEYTEAEKNVAYIYAITLDLDEIDIYENFNSIGGDSIHAMQLMKELGSIYPGMVDISDIFTYPTVEELAAFIDKKRAAGKADTITLM